MRDGRFCRRSRDICRYFIRDTGGVDTSERLGYDGFLDIGNLKWRRMDDAHDDCTQRDVLLVLGSHHRRQRARRDDVTQ